MIAVLLHSTKPRFPPMCSYTDKRGVGLSVATVPSLGVHSTDCVYTVAYINNGAARSVSPWGKCNGRMDYFTYGIFRV